MTPVAAAVASETSALAARRNRLVEQYTRPGPVRPRRALLAQAASDQEVPEESLAQLLLMVLFTQSRFQAKPEERVLEALTGGPDEVLAALAELPGAEAGVMLFRLTELDRCELTRVCLEALDRRLSTASPSGWSGRQLRLMDRLVAGINGLEDAYRVIDQRMDMRPPGERLMLAVVLLATARLARPSAALVREMFADGPGGLRRVLIMHPDREVRRLGRTLVLLDTFGFERHVRTLPVLLC